MTQSPESQSAASSPFVFFIRPLWKCLGADCVDPIASTTKIKRIATLELQRRMPSSPYQPLVPLFIFPLDIARGVYAQVATIANSPRRE